MIATWEPESITILGRTLIMVHWHTLLEATIVVGTHYTKVAWGQGALLATVLLLGKLSSMYFDFKFLILFLNNS